MIYTEYKKQIGTVNFSKECEELFSMLRIILNPVEIKSNYEEYRLNGLKFVRTIRPNKDIYEVFNMNSSDYSKITNTYLIYLVKQELILMAEKKWKKD